MLDRYGTPQGFSNVRGALLLGVLLLLALVSFALISLNIYSQLDRTRQVGRDLVAAERQLSGVLQAQIDEETGIRGFVATRDRFFLEPYDEAARRFDGLLQTFDGLTRQLRDQDIDVASADVRVLHRRWELEVAHPLTANPGRADAARRLKLGKTLIDRVRADANRMNDFLQQRLAVVQVDVQHSIDTTLGSAIGLIVVFGSLGFIFVFARARLRTRIARGRVIVAALQRAYLSGIDTFEGARVGAAYKSATRYAGVGGDLFDVVRLDPGRALVMLADVSGKGVEAAVNTALVKYSIRTLAFDHEDPAAILKAFNEIFLRTIKDPSLFVAVFVGVIDTAAMRVAYGNAGIAGAFLRRADKVKQFELTGPVIGLDRSMTFETRMADLRTGDLLVFATDGLSEARNRRGELLGIEGAIELLRATPTEPQRCADALAEAVHRRTSRRLRDDLAVLAIAVDGV
jgi:serine phosphatase RsbU (regulator of sigma subunit)